MCLTLERPPAPAVSKRDRGHGGRIGSRDAKGSGTPRCGWFLEGLRAVFAFSFRMRYGADAKTAPSQGYDHYNPEAARVLPPVRFVVR